MSVTVVKCHRQLSGYRTYTIFWILGLSPSSGRRNLNDTMDKTSLCQCKFLVQIPDTKCNTFNTTNEIYHFETLRCFLYIFDVSIISEKKHAQSSLDTSS